PNVEETQLPHIAPFEVHSLRGELAFSFSGLHSSVDRYVLAHGYMPDAARSSSVVAAPERTSKRREHMHKVLLLPDPHRVALARAFESAVVAQLEEKIVLALNWCAQNRQSILDEIVDDTARFRSEVVVKHVVMSGGVASNMFFRKRLRTCLEKNFPEQDLELVFPPPSLCTDNAAMIGWASMHRFLAGEMDDYTIDHKAKWSIEELGQ
ncbi:hypothetical protein EW145_g2889, partial [Phellinidium pouzarii]